MCPILVMSSISLDEVLIVMRFCLFPPRNILDSTSSDNLIVLIDESILNILESLLIVCLFSMLVKTISRTSPFVVTKRHLLLSATIFFITDDKRFVFMWMSIENSCLFKLMSHYIVQITITKFSRVTIMKFKFY